MKTKKYYIGDSCVCWSLGNEMKEEYSNIILYIYAALKKRRESQTISFLDVVPGYNSLAVHFIPGSNFDKTVATITDLFKINKKQLQSIIKGHQEGIKTIEIPVVYDGEDLERVARITHLSIDQVVALHSKPIYRVAMIGFRPHFPYLLGLDRRLATERLESPRMAVSAGAIAIGGAQTGIYPEISPGGWNIIGHTNAVHLKQITPGDKISFKIMEVL